MNLQLWLVLARLTLTWAQASLIVTARWAIARARPPSRGRRPLAALATHLARRSRNDA